MNPILAVSLWELFGLIVLGVVVRDAARWAGRYAARVWKITRGRCRKCGERLGLEPLFTDGYVLMSINSGEGERAGVWHRAHFDSIESAKFFGVGEPLEISEDVITRRTTGGYQPTSAPASPKPPTGGSAISNQWLN